MAIPGLAVHDAEMLYRQQFGEDLDPALARAVVQQTAGNPLFLKELLRTLADTGEVRTTDTIRDVLTRRIDRLPPGSEAALTIGALCPNGFNEQLIATLTKTSDDEALEVLEAALAAGLIEEDPASPQQFRFAHAVIADTLAGGLSSPRRSRLHVSIGDALETHNVAAATLAHHFLRGARAGSGHRAAEYSHRAAGESLRFWDYAAADQLLEAGLEPLDLAAVDDDALRADMLIDLVGVRKHQD